MTKEEQEKRLEEIFNTMRDVILKKGNDYANLDRLSNFKLAGSVSGLSAEQNCLSLIATKVARLGVLFNSTESPNNESILDSIVDLGNYAVLLNMIVTEDNLINSNKISSYEQV